MENNFTNLTEKETNDKFSSIFDIPINLPKSIKKASYIFLSTILLEIVNTIISNQRNDGILFSTLRMISVSVGIYSLMVYHFYNILKGKEWARRLYAVLFPLFTLLTLTDTINYLKNNSAIGVITVAIYGLQFLTLIFLFNRESKDWYLRTKEAVIKKTKICIIWS